MRSVLRACLMGVLAGAAPSCGPSRSKCMVELSRTADPFTGVLAYLCWLGLCLLRRFFHTAVFFFQNLFYMLLSRSGLVTRQYRIWCIHKRDHTCWLAAVFYQDGVVLVFHIINRQ